MMQPLRVTVWHEHRHEQQSPVVQQVYPQGMHAAVEQAITSQLGEAVTVRHALLDDPEHGLSDAVLAETDVMTWWGHMAHDEVDDDIVEKVHQRVLEGMGLIVLHSGHYAKIFKKLMGTGCGLKFREEGERERLWVVNPGHEIADGLPEFFDLPQSEMYGELFDIPAPDELVLLSWHEGGEVFRSGCCFTRGKGRIFYFAPGHETFPIYYDPTVQRVIANAVRWAQPRSSARYTFKAERREREA